MSGAVALEALDLAALLCSRVCHDLISPIGAIVNGLEVLDEAKDEETKTFALDLIKKSAKNASARLQFCRLAFGAAGSAGAQIDLGDAENVARGFIEDDKIKLAWNLPRAAAAEEPGQAAAQHAGDRRPGDPARRHPDGRSDRRGRDDELPGHRDRHQRRAFRQAMPGCWPARRPASRSTPTRSSPITPACWPATAASPPTMTLDGDKVVVAAE